MKISKLFHWLYAFVMFLPVFALGGTLLISTFNMSAKQETEITYKYESNEVNSINDLYANKLYEFDTFRLESDSYDSFNLYVLKYDGLDFNPNVGTLDETINGAFDSNINDFFVINIASNDVFYDFYFYYTNADTYQCVIYEQNTFIEFTNLIFFTDSDGIEIIKSICENNDILPHYTNYNKIDSVETHNLNTRDVFYNALDDIKTSPYFNWAYNSFLAQPLVYIVTLFSIPANHIVVELLSYWLAISIIWLVFDLIMYVPLLVHRWLDKGVLE